MDMTRDGLIPTITGSERSYLRVVYDSMVDMRSQFRRKPWRDLRLARANSMAMMQRFQQRADDLRGDAMGMYLGPAMDRTRTKAAMLDAAAEFLFYRADDQTRALMFLRMAKERRADLAGVEG